LVDEQHLGAGFALLGGEVGEVVDAAEDAEAVHAFVELFYHHGGLCIEGLFVVSGGGRRGGVFGDIRRGRDGVGVEVDKVGGAVLLFLGFGRLDYLNLIFLL
jgi:hypothetical protein